MEPQTTVLARKNNAVALFQDVRSFRIATLSPGHQDDVLHVILKVHCLEEQDLDYEAILYCWSQGIGDTIEDTWDYEMKCGEDTIRVPRNLGRALRRLRYRDRHRRLWMDSVCIDQQDVAEKSSQVALMGEIFAKATRVVVWLGEEDSNTECAYRIIKLLNQAVSILATQDEARIHRAVLKKQVTEVAGLRAVSRKEIQVMVDLLQRAWFERAWVYQESVLARETVVKTGSFEIAGNAIVSMVQCRGQYGMSYIGSKPENLVALDRAYAMLLPLKERLDFETHFWEVIFWALRARRGAKTADPRDVIYSLLGVAAGRKSPLIKPDYTLSWRLLYVWVARKIIEGTHKLDILGEAIAVPTATAHTSNALPSWVPDWRVPIEQDTKLNTDSNIEAGPNRRRFLSTGVSVVSLVEDENSFSGKLKLQGIHMDIVESVQPSAGWASWKELDRFLRDEIYWPTREPMQVARIKMLSLDASYWDPKHPDYVPKGAVYCVDNYEEYLRGEKERVDLAIMRTLTRFRRKMLLSSGGFFGVAPESVKVGDHIFLLSGAEFPVVLRRHPTEEVEYQFVGECYIHGLMHGQGMTMVRERVDPTYNDPSDVDALRSRLRKEKLPLGLGEVVIS
jgi:hypothetical protein